MMGNTSQLSQALQSHLCQLQQADSHEQVSRELASTLATLAAHLDSEIARLLQQIDTVYQHKVGDTDSVPFARYHTTHQLI